MNTLILDSSSTFGTLCIDFFFENNNNIHLVDYSSGRESEINQAVDTLFSTKKIDSVVLCYPERLFHSLSTTKELQRNKNRLLDFHSGILRSITPHLPSIQTIILLSSVLIYPSGEADETTPTGDSIVSDFFNRLEKSCQDICTMGNRFISLRLGSMISQNSDVPQITLPYCKERRPVPMRRGKLQVSWVSRRDVLRAFSFVLEKNLQGPINIVSGDFVKQDDLCSFLRNKNGLSPTIPLPSWLIQMIQGKEMSELLHQEIIATPSALINNGFLFNDISIEEFLKEKEVQRVE